MHSMPDLINVTGQQLYIARYQVLSLYANNYFEQLPFVSSAFKGTGLQLW